MQYLGAIWKTTEWPRFISRANCSISQESKPMPQSLMPMKLKLTGSMQTYKTFRNYHQEKDALFIIGDGMQSIKLRDTWNNRQVWPLSTKWSRADANQENKLVIENTLFQQHKRWLYTWTSPDDQNRNQIDYILCSQRRRHSIQLAKTDLELSVAQIMSSLLQNSGLNWRTGKPIDHSGMT